MWNEKSKPSGMKGQGPELCRHEATVVGSSSTTSPPLSASTNLLGLNGLCDQITSLGQPDLSHERKDPYPKSPEPPLLGAFSNQVLSNSHLGSALHNSVARSFSDSTKHDRAKNVYAHVDQPIHLNSRGWHTDYDPGLGGSDWQGSYNSLYFSKTHNEVSRSQSDQAPSNNEKTFLQLLNSSPGSCHDQESLQKLYKAKVIFALKLGYSEAILQNALRKVGLHSGENQLLEELITLQKKKLHTNDILDTHSGQLLREERGSSFSIRSDSGVDVSEKETDLLPIVIDGSNVAMSHGNKERFSCKGIRICVDWFFQRGHRDITVFVPMWRKESPKVENPISDQHILGELQKENFLAFTPSRQVSGRRYVCHDDRYILNLACETGAIVVSNDNYRDLVNDKPDYKKVIEEKVLMYTFVSDRFMPPDDPLGRGGPSLEVFLRKPKPVVATQLCPYEKKCTYGYKCKFYHPERNSLPQKSISETLKENSNRKIYEVRSRSPTGEIIGDPLSRTPSMQSNDQRFSSKKALSRTKSLNPNIERTGMHPHFQDQTIWTHQFDPERQSLNMHHRLRVGSEAIPSLHQTLIDTSVPPPSCLSWKRFESSDLMGHHQKLERQLTLNPHIDLRLPVTQIPGDPSIPDLFAYPPPIIANLRQLHSPVKRNSSAPEVTSAGAISRSPIPTMFQMDHEKSSALKTSLSSLNNSALSYRQGPGVIGDRFVAHYPPPDFSCAGENMNNEDPC